jgi:hypothetical protein
MIGPKRCEESELAVMVLFKMLKLGGGSAGDGKGRIEVGGNENPFVLYYLDRRAWRFWFN